MKISDSVNEAGVFPPKFRSVLNPFAGRISVGGCRGLESGMMSGLFLKRFEKLGVFVTPLGVTCV